MLPYFPFSSAFDLKMGTSPLPNNHPVVEIDRHYYQEVMLKRKLLTGDHTYYYQSTPLTHTAQWEALEKILQGLSNAYPEKFVYSINNEDRNWENKLLNEKCDFVFGDNGSLSLEPLDFAGRQVQEDLLLLDAGSVLQAGQLCFPSGWDLASKFGKHFLDLHAPVPSRMGPTLLAADKLIERLPLNKPIARTNWGYRITNQLDLSSRHTADYRMSLNKLAAKINPENAGDEIFLRSERQTLTRLHSGYVLFTIHTYNSKVKDECQDAGRAKAMLTFLQTTPAELIEYKVMTPIVTPLIQYLENVGKSVRAKG